MTSRVQLGVRVAPAIREALAELRAAWGVEAGLPRPFSESEALTRLIREAVEQIRAARDVEQLRVEQQRADPGRLWGAGPLG